MRVEALKEERVDDFLGYCRKHKMELDDSFLYEEDLNNFISDENNPTYVIVDGNGRIRAAASLIIDEYHRRGRRGRFRIFHSEVSDIEYYEVLLQAMVKHTEGLDKIFIFVPITNEKLIKFISELKFTVERYSFLLVREEQKVPDFELPIGYSVRTFTAGRDEKAWCDVRNSAFAKLAGSETPITTDRVKKMVEDSDYIEGAMMIMYHKEKPVGVIKGSMDDYENLPIVNIGPLAIIPEHQGKGLGRILLRTLLKFVQEHSCKRTVLCVNAENERAKALYLQEGFKQVEAVVCLKYSQFANLWAAYPQRLENR